MAKKKDTTDNSSFLDFAKQVKDEDTRIAAEGLNSAEFTGTIDTGCYILNALISGSIFGGAHNNKITAFAGESSTGKTFLVLGIIKNFLDSNPNGGVIYYDTEAAVTKEMMTSRGIDANRIITSEPATIQDFTTKFTKMINSYMKIEESKRPPMLAVLDSLSMLPSSKELEDTKNEKDVRDMTKSGAIRGAFRMITLACAKAKIPLLVTSHTYTGVTQYGAPQVVGGGGGLKYSASTIVKLSKAKDKDDDKQVVGNIITMKLEKGRLARENAIVKARLSYDTGLDRYYGLLELAEAAGIFKKNSTKYLLPSGESKFKKEIINDPQSVFTEEILGLLNEAAKEFFTYGGKGRMEEEINAEAGGTA